MQLDRHAPPASFWRSHFGLGWLVLAAVAAWFLWSEHRTRLHGALPYAPESTGGATP
jgi:hypothetical protein